MDPGRSDRGGGVCGSSAGTAPSAARSRPRPPERSPPRPRSASPQPCLKRDIRENRRSSWRRQLDMVFKSWKIFVGCFLDSWAFHLPRTGWLDL